MIDNLMKKYGYTLIEENKYGAYYEKIEDEGYSHIIAIGRKFNKKHVMQSYDKKSLLADDNQYFNSCCGVEIPVLLLCWLKAKYMIFKYKWNK